MIAIALAMRLSRSSRATPLLRRPSAILSCTVFQGNSANCWKTTARSGPGPVTRRPSTLTLPLVGNSKPATMRRHVVLPQPDGPTIATNSSSAMTRSMRSTATMPVPLRANVFCTASNVIAAIAGASRQSATSHGGFERAQRDVDRKADEADRDHRAHHGRGRGIELRLHHHEADTGGGDDQLGANKRLPAEARGDAQARDDRGRGGGQQDLDDDAQVAGAEHLGGLDQRPGHEAGAAIRVDQAGRKRAREDDQDRPADAGAEPQRRERHPGDRRDEAQPIENRRDDLVEHAEPAHQQTERDADGGAEQEAVGETQRARGEVLLQRRAGEWGAEQLDEAARDLVGGGQELMRHEAGERQEAPDTKK